MEDPSTLIAARAFARSLNILLKTVRLYGADHERTTALLGTAWDDLRSTMRGAGESGLLLGVSGTQVLLDGAPLDKRPTDRSFAQLLSSAGLASINFSQRVTLEDFWQFVRAFSVGSSKPGALAEELRVALGGDKGNIRVNQVRFVAQDASLGETALAAQLAAQSLGSEAKKLQSWLEDPQRLLQLIAAAEGARSQPTGLSAITGELLGMPNPAGQGTASAAAGQAPVPSGPPAQEDDVLKVLQWLSQLGQTAQQPESVEAVGNMEEQMHRLPAPGQAALTQALLSLSSQAEPPRPDDPLLVQLAERVAVRFALERFEHGDVKTNAVVELLGRLKREIGSLRQILQTHEEKMGEAGLQVETHADILDRKFWAGVPERHKLKMLLSREAWAIPPRNIRQFVEELLERGDVQPARNILKNYAECVRGAEPDACRKASAGLSDLADLYSRANHSLLKSTLHQLGDALTEEANADLQTMLGASFVRFSHEAGAKRQYPAVQEALVMMEQLEQRQPGLARLLWPRIKVGNPLPEFIDEALRAPCIPEGLIEVLRRMPHATVDQVASRITHCARRDEWERLLELVQGVGSGAVIHLRKTLQSRPAPEAANKVALLSRLEPKVLEELLPSRLRSWDQVAHDLVVRQLANGLAPQRGKLIDEFFDIFNACVLPEAVDELGISGDSATAPRLIRILERESADSGTSYLQIKAIEALGRLREPKAEVLLRPLAESRRFWTWLYPRELRITAVQALKKIDPEWTKRFLPGCGLSDAELNLEALDPDPDTPWLRQRRYKRINLPKPLFGNVIATQGNCKMTLQQLSLGGGVARSQCHVKPGNLVGLEFSSGMSHIRADVLVRESRPQELAFELVKIDLADRGKLRRPLVGLQSKAN